MSPAVVAATTFGIMVVAELPDKTFIASLVLGARYRALPVWWGVAGAFGVHVLLAVSAGSLVTLLPGRVRDAVVAALFAAGAGWLLLHRDAPADPVGDLAPGAVPGGDPSAGPGGDPSAGPGAGPGGDPPARAAFARAAATAFWVIFLAEWGDLTQIVIIDLAARYDDPVAVGAGAAAGLWAVGGLGVFAGSRVLRRIPVHLLHLATGLVLAGFAVAAALGAAGG